MTLSHTQPHASSPATIDAPWWKHGVLYQIYPRSFADSNGDGIGDLRGITEQLDYLAWLGIDGIWLSPITVSPNRDWGYDVADYYEIDPELGTLADLDELVREAKERGIRIVMDLVPNHSSDLCEWFIDACSSRDSDKRDWYVWADPGENNGHIDPTGDGTRCYPNNWLSYFGGSTWTWHEETGQYYMHNFLAEQPDLNFWNKEVRDEFESVLRFWMDRGIAGFRIDVCHGIIHDDDLRDNPPREKTGHMDDEWPQQRMYNVNRPEVHPILKSWRKVTDQYDGGMLLGETGPESLDELAAFYGNGHDELHLAFNFPFIHAGLTADALRTIVEQMETIMPGEGWPVWTVSNHDVTRVASRWCGHDNRRVLCALSIMLLLRGTPVLYYGDEIGMPNVDVPVSALRDPVGIRQAAGELPNHEAGSGRDGERSPMQWNADATTSGGFTDADVTPWLPAGKLDECNVEDQQHDDDSILNTVRALLALRRSSAELMLGSYTTLASSENLWVWKRGTHTIVAANVSDTPHSHTVIVDAQNIELELSPWEVRVTTLPGAANQVHWPNTQTSDA